ncbi:MAG: hypothetical protein HY785_25185 [Oscillatoriophycideae cyanobacterium NC_groundwater_1537_Pr4_S-0.65um_50_18]|nr:hypothetical protein [Oscillatoriophycideae cyanobacterium NC_groundwater_1537_Pr4_S-0.65um_50_18]
MQKAFTQSDLKQVTVDPTVQEAVAFPTDVRFYDKARSASARLRQSEAL